MGVQAMIRRLLALLALLAGLAVPVIAAAPAHASTSPGNAALRWAEVNAAGHWYAWGGTGPSYDCSGLVMEAYGHADGIWLPHNTVAMLRSGRLHWEASPHPGDLVMWGGSFPYHVELWLRPGWTYGAQHSGTTVGAHQLWGSYAFYRAG